MSIYEKCYGPEHMSVGVTLGTLGNAYGYLGDARKKRELLERSLPILEKNGGPDQFSVAVALIHLGAASGDLGDLAAKSEFIQRAIRIARANGRDDAVQQWTGMLQK